MKKIITIGICLFLCSIPAQADIKYISDTVKTALRTGPGAGHQVIAMLQSGEKVEVVSSENEWTEVRLVNGKHGWVLSSLLSSAKPKILLLEQTTTRNQALISQVSDLTNKNNELKESIKTFDNEQAQLKKKLQETVRSYEKLQQESKEFIELQAKYKKTTLELESYARKVSELEEQIEKIKSDQKLKWFLIGAGVLFTGFLLGIIARRQKPRYSL